MSDRSPKPGIRIASPGWLAAAAICALLLPGIVGAQAPQEAADQASATLPLEKILTLYRERDEAERSRDTAPPVAAALQQLELTGRLLADGIDFQAHFEVLVLADDAWVSVPLLAYEEGSHVSKLPNVKDAAFAISEGQLVFLSKKRGRYTFDLSLYRAASKDQRSRRVTLSHGGAALATCKLEIDGGLFQLTTADAIEARDGVRVFARGDAFEIAWEVRERVEPEPTGPSPALAIESVIPRTHVATVSTLEGRRITRVLYELRFAGRKPIAIELPEGQVLERAFLNGVATSLEAVDGTLELEMAPARAGEEGGTLELVLSQAGGVYHLAGEMHFDLPAVSWPTHKLFLTLHLPQVFDYRWAGGSLEPQKAAPRAEYSYQIPAPGKALHFRQVLIDESAPDLDLDYEVDLTGHYFQDDQQGSRM